ncbi:EAL domain-containing protein [Phenylobacterium sp.]|uniref:bifunctional diguanylate cyclase/phosphodiesterase n=1 Tax=Phenylobacterium sp. TaxID=1871053 RepID=UPI0035B35FE5
MSSSLTTAPDTLALEIGRAAFASPAHALCMLDADLRLVALNEPAAHLIAGARDRIGQGVREVFPGAAGADLERRCREALASGRIATFEASHPSLQVWCDVHACPTPTGLVLFFRDASARQRLTSVARALEAREQELALIFHQAAVGLMLTDAAGGLRLVNQRFCQILGRSAEALKGLSFKAYTHPEDLARNAELFARGLATGQPFQLEKRYLRPDGAIVWCAVHVSFVTPAAGGVSSILVLAEEITARKAAEASLATKEQLLQIVVDSVDDLIFVKHRDGRFALTNRALDEACGELIGLTTSERFDADLADGYEAVDQRVMETGAPQTVEEIIPVKGAPRAFQTVKVPWRCADEIVGVIGVSRDVTERQRAEAALRQSEALNRSIVEGSRDSIVLLDLAGRIVFANLAGLAQLGARSLAELQGRAWEDAWPRNARRRLQQALENARRGRVGKLSGSLREQASRTWWDVVVSPVLDDQGRPRQLLAIARDLTPEKQAEERIRWSATHDALTELPNRRLFSARLQGAIDAARGRRTAAGLLLLDIDNFKLVNDTHGHGVGDQLLRQFVARLRRLVRAGDTLARLGGDEFALILPDAGAREDLAGKARAILSALEAPFDLEGLRLACRASIGASLFPDDGRSAQDLLTNADIALYRAKARGRAGVEVFTPALRADYDAGASMRALAQDALARRLITPYFQPKVDLADGQVVGFEALLRVREPGGAIHPPSAIRAAFDDVVLSTRIGEHIIRQVLSTARGFLERSLSFGAISINCSAAELSAEDFPLRLLRWMSEAGLRPEMIELEVTEDVVLGHGADQVTRALTELRQAGLGIAMDDFGTGYASLAHLKALPVSALKIDRRFVSELATDGGDEAIVRTIIQLGASLGLKVIAEGIENRDQLAVLRRLGCAYGQGFLFAAALPAREATHLLQSRRSLLPGHGP